jgi:phosphatidylglycerol:prolipoprotein diacylglycerol transferase
MIPFPDISPEIFSFSVLGINIALRWYALSYICGFMCALQIMKIYIRRQSIWAGNTSPMCSEDADTILTYLIIGVILGGRLGYVLFYNLGYYVERPQDIIKVWDGGMAFHGGFLGVILAVIFYAKLNKLILWSVADLIALATPPGLLFGRLANFINAELWGRPTSMPWGVIFPGERAQDCEMFEGICSRHPSQLYEAMLEGLLLMLLLVFLSYRGALRLPGLVAGVFFVGYGCARFFVEYYRVPDPQFFSSSNTFGFAFRLGDLGVTMGQTLSLPMIIVGSSLIYLACKSKRLSNL